MKIRILIVCILAAATGIFISNLLNDNEGPKVDPALASIIALWQADMESADIDCIAGFNRIEEIRIVHSVVEAGHYDLGSRTIDISIEVMEKGFFSTKAAVYHELGHFVFDLKHNKEVGSIMYYKQVSNDEYINTWDIIEDTYLIKCKAHEWNGRL